MTEQRGHRLERLLSVFVCAMMLTGLMVIVPDEAKAYPEDAWIVGNVTDGTNPLENVYVKAMVMMGDGEQINWSVTDASGDYSMMVPGGLSFIVFAADGDYYMGMNSVTVPPGETRTCNFTLTPVAEPKDVTIYGFVTDEDGDPRWDGRVLGMVMSPLGGDMPYYANITTPDPSTGYFEVNVIAGPRGGGAVAMDFPDYPMAQNDTTDPLESETSYEFNIRLEPMTFNDDAVVYGYLTDLDSGMPLRSAVVSYELYDGMDSFRNWTMTNETGYYEMDVHSGNGLQMTFQRTGYTIEFYRLDVPPAGSVQQDAVLRVADAKIRGNVTDEDTGFPIQFCRVFLVDDPMMQENMTMAITDFNGYYELDAFEGIDLYFGADQDGYASNFTRINVTSGEELWYNFALRPYSAWLVGQVTSALNGTPLENATVHVRGPVEKYEWTNSTGMYNVSLVPGDYSIEVNRWGEFKTYYNNRTIPDGVETVLDIALVPWQNALVKGHLYDMISGDPVPFANVWITGQWWGYGTTSNGTGDYEMFTVDGNSTIYVNAPGYQWYSDDLFLPELSTTVFDIGLMPQSPATTALVHGYVTNSNDSSPIGGAEVRFRLEGTHSEYWNWTNSSGYYEVLVPPWGLNVRVTASEHAPFFGQINMSGVSDYALDVVLDRDLYEPNMTYSQSPRENISWPNPSLIQALIEEQNLREITLIIFMEWNSSGPDSNWTMVDWKRTLLDPWSPESGLPYSMVDGNYSVNQPWNGTIQAGWLSNGTDSAYFAASSSLLYMEPVYAVGGFYTNATSPRTQGSALFNASTGQFSAFVPMYMGSPSVVAPDPTGVFEPQCLVIEYNESGIADFGWRSMGAWDVNGLTFAFDALVPSGNYKTEFYTNDWGGKGNWSIVDLTVDNEMPAADAGPPQNIPTNTVVTLDGSGSSDNVGIATYVWEFYNATGVWTVLSGELVTYSFEIAGSYDVNLTVWDGAGHSSTDSLIVDVFTNLPPVADAGFDMFVYAGDMAWFDGSLSWDDFDPNWMLEYTWAFAYGSSTVELTGMYPGFRFIVPGVYEVELTVKDTGGLEDSASIFVTVNMVPSAWWADPATGETLVDGATISLDHVILRGYTDPDEEVDVITPTATYQVFADGDGFFELDPVELSEGINYVTVMTYVDWIGWIVTLNKMIVSDTYCMLWLDSPESPTSAATVHIGGWTDTGAELTVNGIPVTVLPDGTFGIDMALLEGPNPFNVTATDSVGNMNWAEFVVELDTAPPSPVIAGPAGGSNVSEPNVLVYGTVDSGASVRVNGVLAAGGTNWSATVSLVEGANTIVVTAMDSLGNTATQTLVINYVPPVYVTPEELAALQAELLGEINNLSADLQNNISDLQDQIYAAMADIAGLQTLLADGISDLQAQINSTMNDIAALQLSLADEVSALQDQINATIDDIAALRASVDDNLSLVHDRIDAAMADIDGLQASLLNNVTALQAQINAAVLNISALQADLTANVAALQGQINAAVLNISALQADLTANVTAIQTEIASLEADLQANITALQQAIAQNATALQQSLAQNVTALQSQIAVLRADLQANVTSLNAAIAANVTALQGLVDTLDQDVADMEAELVAMNATLAAAQDQMDDALDSMQADLTEMRQQIDDIEETAQDVEQKAEDTDSFASLLMYLMLILFAIAVVMVAIVWLLTSRRLGGGGTPPSPEALEEVEGPTEVEREFESLEKEIKDEEL